jgi:hypothetical protein
MSLLSFLGLDGQGRTVSTTDRLPVDIGQNVSVQLGAEVEVKNDTGNPIPFLASPTDPTGNGTRQYDWTNSLRQAVSSTSTAAIAFPSLGTSREVMFHASSRCFVRMGDGSVSAASIAAGQMVLEAGERFHIRLAVGVTHFRVIRDTADGFLNIAAVS